MRLDPSVRVVPLIVAAGLAVATAACGEKKSSTGDASAKTPPGAAVPKTFLTMDDYKSVCAEGKGVEGAAAYEKKPGAASPFAHMYKDTAGGEADWKQSFDSTTKPWKAEDAKDAQLVACHEVVKADMDHECKFEKGSVMKRFKTTSKITVYEAKSGKKLAEQTAERVSAGCPMVAFLDEKKANRDYPSGAPDVLAAVAPYQPADAPSPRLHADTFDAACNGKPAVGAGKVSKEPGKYNPYVAFTREKEAPWKVGAANEFDFDESAWFDANLAAQSNDKEPRVSVAVCMTSTRGQKAQDCAFMGGNSLTMYAASWKVDVVEASTGKVLQTKTFTGKNECPSIWSFDRGKEYDALPGDDMRDWLRPVVSPK